MRVRRTLAWRIARWLAAALLGPVILFSLFGWIGSSVARNGDWVEPVAGDEQAIEVLIGSNGIHTEIVMPLVTPQMDWRLAFPASDLLAPTRPYTHVAVSWGERAFFLETPTWLDLSPTTAINALTGGKAVLHVAHYVHPAPDNDMRVLRLRPSEYRALTQAIASHLAPPGNRETLPGYARHDVFYTALGTYHLANTCNQWTSDQLAASGVEVGQWTPFPGGVMKWVPDLQDR